MHILFRCDTSTQIGTGHFMRCLSLARACRALGDNVSIAMAQCPEWAEARVSKHQIAMLRLATGSMDNDCEQCLKLARQAVVDAIVLDGYHFDSSYALRLKNAGFKLLLIDDLYGYAQYCAHWVLNQNSYADASKYGARDDDTQLLLGTKFALLRPEFEVFARKERKFPQTARNLLMTFGGSDPAQFTSKALEALSNTTATLDTVLLVGGSNPKRAEIETAAHALGEKVQVRVDIQNVAEVMEWADFAVAAAGSTCWELACMRVPSALCVIADNQREIANVMEKNHAAVNLGWHADIVPQRLAQQIDRLAGDRTQRVELSENIAAICDGLGAARVAKTLHGECTNA